jgi:hypothetical protein
VEGMAGCGERGVRVRVRSKEIASGISPDWLYSGYSAVAVRSSSQSCCSQSFQFANHSSWRGGSSKSSRELHAIVSAELGPRVLTWDVTSASAPGPWGVKYHVNLGM